MSIAAQCLLSFLLTDQSLHSQTHSKQVWVYFHHAKGDMKWKTGLFFLF